MDDSDIGMNLVLFQKMSVEEEGKDSVTVTNLLLANENGTREVGCERSHCCTAGSMQKNRRGRTRQV
jgi:hypothetical protein